MFLSCWIDTKINYSNCIKNMKSLPLLHILELCESTSVWWDNCSGIYKHNLFYWDLNIKHQNSSKWGPNDVVLHYACSQRYSSWATLWEMLNIRFYFTFIWCSFLFSVRSKIIVEAQCKEAVKKNSKKQNWKILNLKRMTNFGIPFKRLF